MKLFRITLIPILLLVFAVFAFAESAQKKTKPTAVPVDPNLTVILSDVHIGVDAMKKGYAANNEVKLQVLLDRIVAMNPRPARALILGDLAYGLGTVADYKKSQPVLQTLDRAGIPWTLAYGNHDRRAPFTEVYPEKTAKTQIPGKLVSIVSNADSNTDNACDFDFILLDSLNEGTVESIQDQKQVEWLDKKLAEYKSKGKKTFVCAHHNSDEAGVRATIDKYPGTVVGYLFGHTHRVHRPENVGKIPHFGMPSTGYVPKGYPCGFMTLRAEKGKFKITLMTSDPSDKQNGKVWESFL